MENLPIELSADGKRNAYSHPCTIMGYRANFAVCLHLIAKRKEGRLSAIYADCSAAIGKKACPALKMRKEELDKGQAIYFVERQRSGAVINPVSTPTFNNHNKSSVSNTKQTVKKAKPVDVLSIARIDGGGIADAINNALEAEQQRITQASNKAQETGRPVVTATQMPKITQLPGESLLDMAKRVRQLRQQGA